MLVVFVPAWRIVQAASRVRTCVAVFRAKNIVAVLRQSQQHEIFVVLRPAAVANDGSIQILGSTLVLLRISLAAHVRGKHSVDGMPQLGQIEQ